LFAKATPEELFRYFLKSYAFALSLNAQYQIKINGILVEEYFE